jgi:hypothetical protein
MFNVTQMSHIVIHNELHSTRRRMLKDAPSSLQLSQPLSQPLIRGRQVRCREVREKLLVLRDQGVIGVFLINVGTHEHDTFDARVVAEGADCGDRRAVGDIS